MAANFGDLVGQVEQQPPFRVTRRLLLDTAAANRVSEINDELARLSAAAQATAQDDDDDVTVKSPADVARGLLDEWWTIHEQHEPSLFVFEQLPAVDFYDLDGKHRGDRGMKDPFWLHVMAASCVTPEGATVALFERLRASLNHGNFETLRLAAEEAQVGVFDTRPTSAASALRSVLRPSSKPPTDTESE